MCLMLGFADTCGLQSPALSLVSLFLPLLFSRPFFVHLLLFFRFPNGVSPPIIWFLPPLPRSAPFVSSCPPFNALPPFSFCRCSYNIIRRFSSPSFRFFCLLFRLLLRKTPRFFSVFFTVFFYHFLFLFPDGVLYPRGLNKKYRTR